VRSPSQAVMTDSMRGGDTPLQITGIVAGISLCAVRRAHLCAASTGSRRRRLASLPMPGQLSFFSAGSQSPRVEDLTGLLCGPAQIARRGSAARISVVLVEEWRVEALWAELALRGVDGEVVTADESDGWSGSAGAARSVRTPFASALSELATAWGGSGGGKRPPTRLVLDGQALRLWYIAAGRRFEGGFSLGLGEHDEACWDAVGAALSQAGLPSAFVGPRGAGPAYRLTSAKRMLRLSEMVGDAPAGVPAGLWPT
jgi:hypothetical protein